MPENLRVSRESIIAMGMEALHEIGSDYICSICIINGGSCCQGCKQLAPGVGCQLRNTGCTAWLCGFLKFFLYELGLLQEWIDFWDEVPGQGYREDYTPETFVVTKELRHPDIRKLGESFAADLRELTKSHLIPGFILNLREKFDRYIDLLMEPGYDPQKRGGIKQRIKIWSGIFQQFQQELREYKHMLNV
ncbi:hypothetical protein A8990_14031 [Paenibacillus taihuensis]|uniref:DNA mismatch repair protein n=1 Tax=Paenibacillus taihuensis TaxID=1156355 RepID=A0A3D9R3S6_9BACL|nr:DNA mismatch repair protein [Paenibacillus taihuensis]REE67982.1 hypothetical protein A8990_14031 [Paenibacillus taihuensis]